MLDTKSSLAQDFCLEYLKNKFNFYTHDFKVKMVLFILFYLKIGSIKYYPNPQNKSMTKIGKKTELINCLSKKKNPAKNKVYTIKNKLKH